MSWKEFYLSPEGRVTRAEWWQKLFLPTFGLVLVTMILDNVLGWTPRYLPWGVLSVLASWLLIYPSIVVCVKRLHDHNKSGWWYLAYMVPIAGWVWIVIECGCLRGTVGDNRYGPDPLPPPNYATYHLGSGPGPRGD